MSAEMVCPECGEPARHRIPNDLIAAYYETTPVPEWSHRDGTQLCPVIGSHGYQPAQPIPSRTSTPESE